MKLPALNAKYISLSVILLAFVIGSFFFLFLGPNITKPAEAAGCSTGVASVQQGGTINVGYSGFAAGESVRLFGTSFQQEIGKTNDSTSSLQNTTYTIPAAAPADSYNIVIVTRFPITSTTCTGGPFNVTAATGGPTPSCIINTIPPTQQAGLTVNMGYIGFAAGENVVLAPSAGGSDIPVATLPTDTSGAGATAVAIDFTIPAATAVGTYNVVIVTRFPITRTTCSRGPLSVTAATGGSTCDYTFTPTGGNVAAGGPVTITITSTDPNASTHNFQAGVTNGTINQSNTRTGPGTIIVNAPTSGTGYVVYATDTTLVSQCSSSQTTAISISGTTSTSPTCTPSSAIVDEPALINAMNNCIISANNYDDKAFVKNNIFGLIDALNSSLTGQSSLNPEVNGLLAGTGALAASSNMVAALYTPPASGVTYLAQQFQKLNPVQPAYAQTTGGIGFNALQPVQSIWEAFRNISYVGFIIIFVVVGFMIMFRAHISPQAVATIQDSIPRIVIAIILVTFSYAIAGLFIDIMFLLLNVMLNALAATHLIKDTSFVFTDSVFTVVKSGWGSLVKDTFSAVKDLLSKIVPAIPLGLDKLFDNVAGGIAGIVVGIAVLFIMFRIFFMLLMAYVQIIILTIFAPFFFLFQALPGQNSASTWFKQMASNVLVFPTVAMMFVLAGILSGISAFGAAGGSVISTGQVGQFPLLIGSLPTSAIGSIIGIGILFMTPEAAKMVKDAMGIRGGPGFGGAGAAALTGAAGAMGGFAGRTVRNNAATQAVGDIMAVRGERNRAAWANRVPGVFRTMPGSTAPRSGERIVAERKLHH